MNISEHVVYMIAQQLRWALWAAVMLEIGNVTAVVGFLWVKDFKKCITFELKTLS